MPWESSSLHAFRALSGRTTRTRSSNFRETSRSKACRKVAEALFASSGIRESKAEHSSSSCHTFVPARKQSSSAQYQRPIFSMGRRSWSSHAWMDLDILPPPSSLLLNRDDPEIWPHIDSIINYYWDAQQIRYRPLGSYCTVAASCDPSTRYYILK